LKPSKNLFMRSTTLENRILGRKALGLRSDTIELKYELIPSKHRSSNLSTRVMKHKETNSQWLKMLHTFPRNL
jgi:hypothetical protein